MMKKAMLCFGCAVLSAVLFTGCSEGKSAAGAEESAAAQVTAAVTGGSAVRGRSQADQSRHLNNLKQIGLAIAMYGMSNNESYPSSLADIAGDCGGIDLSPYVYIGNIGNLGRASNQLNIVPVAFLKPQAADDLLLVLRADGHVEAVQIPGLAEKNYRQIVEYLVRDISDSALKRRLIANAEACER